MTIKVSHRRMTITVVGRVIEMLTEPEKELLPSIPTVSSGSVFRAAGGYPILVDTIKVETEETFEESKKRKQDEYFEENFK